MADDRADANADADADNKKADDAEQVSPAADGLEKTVDEDWKAEARREKEKLERKVKEQAASSAQRGPADRDAPPADFLHFVSGMAAQALMQLGEIENVLEGARKTDLAAARYSIDCLQMFAEKTKGNLTDEEDRYLRAALHDLRMRFVDAARTDGTQGGPDDAARTVGSSGRPDDAAAGPSTETSPGKGGPAG